jgi:hypothetical protein
MVKLPTLKFSPNSMFQKLMFAASVQSDAPDGE